ncbi:hypothetical protein GCM10028820_00480 [Tessaracoccus terricola]
MNQTSKRHGLGRRITDMIMASDSPSYGDERERAVVTEAATFAIGISLFVNLAVALVAAVLGAIALPVVLIILAGSPALAMGWYAKQRSVDLNELASRITPTSRAGMLLAICVSFLLIIAAIGWTVFTGSGLVTIPVPDVIGPDATGIGASMMKGAVIGGLGGVLVGFVVMLLSKRRKQRYSAEPTGDELD